VLAHAVRRTLVRVDLGSFSSVIEDGGARETSHSSLIMLSNRESKYTEAQVVISRLDPTLLRFCETIRPP